MFWKTLNTFAFFYSYISLVESGIYFPMGDLELNVPLSDTILTTPLAIFRVLQDTGQEDVKNVNYTTSGLHILLINPVTGVLTFNQQLLQTQLRHSTKDIVTSGYVVASDSNSHNTKTHVSMELQKRTKKTTLDCDLYTKELCFWNSVTYKLYENRKPTVIGSLNSPYYMALCHRHTINYQLLNGTDYLSVERDPLTRGWLLKSLRPFERDVIRTIQQRDNGFSAGAVVYIGVKCTVTTPDGARRDLEETQRIFIQDENDNPPRPQFSEQVVNVRITNDSSLKDQLDKIYHLMFIDRDSIDVNNYTATVHNDYLNLFKLNFTTWSDDRFDEHQTAIHFRLWANDSAHIPETGYEVVLQLNDTTLIPGNGNSTANVTIRFLPSDSFSTLQPAAVIKHQNHLYPERELIFRTAAPLARVTQPHDTRLTYHFRIIKDTSTQLHKNVGAFNVTPVGGIVYVQNIVTLKKSTSPVTLEIQWDDPKTGKPLTDLILINLEEGITPVCNKIGNSIQDWKHCADNKSSNKCIETCGLGTGGKASVTNFNTNGKRCVWRGERKPVEKFTSFYSTCTPDINTCPDSQCDPLESLHPLICPQDCTNGDIWLGHRNKVSNLGIDQGIGACTCDIRQCYCGHQPGVKKTNLNSIPTTTTTTEIISNAFTPGNELVANLMERIETNVSAQRADILKMANSCGTTCLIGIATGSLFILGAFTIVVACWRIHNSGKTSQRNHKYSEDISINRLQDYTNRPATSAETLLLNFDMNTSLTIAPVLPKLTNVVDPKWEFPREKLRIEQTLGEGEFGRVLRAKALEITGLPGYTTVAVKTLKEDARDGELADLMSEYQLLKEVSHPNVIRLLGACTLPGGPVYLIIEFAEHGSLRNYLRRSRHLESEGRVPNSCALLGENEPDLQPICKISPHDILSFAWQISKGMSYLNDMKLVHRDLAARNVLLATGNVCKISDFGLTRDVYEDDTYLKRTKGRVPVKWMAPESLADHIYNSKSDVWSFGILLWELVTLGASPYPGVAVQNLFHLLCSGYRMERPDNCSPILYKIMRICWSEIPKERPSFRTITLKLETMLSDGIDYLDLNPRIVHNRTYFSSIPDSLLTPDEGDVLTREEAVNLCTKKQAAPKCAELDKLQILWKRPEGPNTLVRTYENDPKIQDLSHYESPIKFRNKAEGLKTPTNERPQSYIDMTGPGSGADTQTLLKRSKSRDEIERISKVTSL